MIIYTTVEFARPIHGVYTRSGAWWLSGRFVMSLKLAPAATKEPWGSLSLAVACVDLAWNSDIVSVLCRERLWVVVELKMEWIW